MQMILKLSCGVAAAVVGLLLPILPASAETSTAIKHMPRGANAVMTVDVAKLMQSPLGKQMELQSKLMSGYADRPLAVPATATRVTTAAAVHPMGMESLWQVAIVEMIGEPRLDLILKAQGGFLDTCEGRNSVWSRRDTYYIELDKKTLGVVRPGQRQYVSRWVSGKADAPLSTYLGKALSGAGDADAVFAVDLEGAVGPAGVRYALTMGELPSLEKLDTVQPQLLAAIASVKGMKITMRATDHIDAEWVIEFGSSVAALDSQVKPFVIDVLNAAELGDTSVDQWDFKVDGNRIVGKGKMELAGIGRLLALLSPDDVPNTDDATDKAAPTGNGAAAAQPAADKQTSVVAASQKYFRTIAKSLDGIQAKASPSSGATWLLAQSRMIQQMPVLNVDPDLVNWGNSVADAYARAAQEMAIGQNKAKISAANVASPTASQNYDGAGNATGGDTSDTRAAYRNAQQQRRQAAQAERTAAAERALNILLPVASSRGQMRAAMTQKYSVEF